MGWGWATWPKSTYIGEATRTRKPRERGSQKNEEVKRTRKSKERGSQENEEVKRTRKSKERGNQKNEKTKRMMISDTDQVTVQPDDTKDGNHLVQAKI